MPSSPKPSASRRGCSIVALLASVLATCLLPADASAEPAAGEEVLAAGGLVLVANADVQIEHQDLTIGTDRIRVVSVLRNSGEYDVNLLVTFALPDIDAIWIWDQPPLLPRSGDENFVEAATTANGEHVVPQLEQRATALGLDVTETLRSLAIPLFPYASGLPDRIAALAPAVKGDLVSRGVLKAGSQGLLPAWTLRTTSHWRQLFPAGKSVTLALSYRPVIGRPTGSLAAFERQACLDSAKARRLEASAREGRPQRITVVSFQATAGAAWADPIGQFRLTIDKPSGTAQVATCRTGLSAVSPTQLEWSARDHAHEDDLTVLFAE